MRALGLGASMVDLLDGETELQFVMLGIAAIFRAPIGKNALQRDAVLLIEVQALIVEEIGRGDRRLAIVELGEANFGLAQVPTKVSACRRSEVLQTELHGGEIVPAPDVADPKRRDDHASFQKLVGDASLAPGGLFDGKRHDSVFDIRRHPVLQDGLTP
jgi:hypothetical protein